MGIRWPSTLPLVALTIIMKISGAQVSKYSGQLSLGVYKDELTKPIFYETFVPLLYEYTVPVYKALDVTIRDWRGKCDTENIAPSYTCPVFYHFEKLIERFENDVVPRAWVAKTSTNSSKAVPSTIRNVEDFCNSIQRHFTGSITQQFSFENYIEQLRSCPVGELKLYRAIGDYVYNIKAIFKKMNDNYEAEFSNKFFGSTNAKTGPAFYVNAVTAHQNGLLLAYWVEKTRWTQAQLACNEQRIPEFLLKHQNLSSHIDDLTSKLSLQKQMTSLPAGQVSALYKLPLADCTFIENTGNFVVRVFIPVINKDMIPHIYKLRTVPFIYKDEKWNQEQICQMKPIPGKFLHDEVSGIIQYTDCSSDSLCQVKDQMDSSVDLCVRSIFANSNQGVRRHCPFDCTPINETFNVVKLPLFSRTASDIWVITGRPTSGINIKCPANKDEVLTFQSNGALEVKLPCDCSLTYRSQVLYVESPCKARFEAEPQVTQLTPVHFLKEEMLKDFKPGKSLNNISLPISNNVLPESAKRLDESGLIEGQSGITKQAGTQGAQLGVLWALVILQLCIIIVLVSAAAYKYSKYRNSLAYSKERLVYNIYASPSNNSINETGRPTSSVIDNNVNVL